MVDINQDANKPSLLSFFSLFSCVSFGLVGLLLAGWGLISYDLKRNHDQILDQAREQLKNLAEVYAEETASSLHVLNYVLIDLREEWKNNPEEFGALVASRLMHLNASIFTVDILTANGTLAFSSADWRAPAVDLSDRRYFQFHLLNPGDQFYIDSPLLLRATLRVAIMLSRPLPQPDAGFPGVITVGVLPEYFSRFHDNIALGPDSIITLARVNGELLARSPRPDQALGVTIEEAPWVGASPNNSGFFQKHSEIDQIERVYAWRVLEGGELAVILGQSMQTILVPYHQLRRTYLAWGSAATLLLLVAAYALGRYRLQRAQAKEALRQMEEELAHAQKLESLGQLTGGVAHDFNNILQIISSNIELIHMNIAASKPIAPYVKSMSDALQRGAKLASQLLTFARRQPLHPTPVNSGTLIYGIDSLIQRLVGDAITVSTHIDDKVGNIEVDVSLFENVILNLAANARDAMQGTGTLSITVTNEDIDVEHSLRYPGIPLGKYVSFAISDTGSGMSRDVLTRAFEPFFTTKPAGQGTGLGLAMAYGFVKESGGHIHIDSVLGTGTTIHILLPQSSHSKAG